MVQSVEMGEGKEPVARMSDESEKKNRMTGQESVDRWMNSGFLVLQLRSRMVVSASGAKARLRRGK